MTEQVTRPTEQEIVDTISKMASTKEAHEYLDKIYNMDDKPGSTYAIPDAVAIALVSLSVPKKPDIAE